MATNYSAALRAAPFFRLVFQEFHHALFLNKKQIFNFTHVIKGAVAFIQVFNLPAWEIGTFIAELITAVKQILASSFYRRALFRAYPAAGAIPFINATFSCIMRERKVSGAYIAVHAAWSNQFGFHLRVPIANFE